MRSAITCFVLFLFAAMLGCGSAGMSSSSQAATPASVTVTMQPVQAASPVQVVASATSPYPIQRWQVAVDSAVVWQQASSQPQINQSISLDPGQHQITTTATNTAGSSGSASMAVTIPSSGTAAADPTSLSVALKPIGSSSPTTITAVAQGPRPLTGWAFYVDGNLVDKKNTSDSTLSETVQMTVGKHQIIARVWDNSGAYAAATATADITASTSNITSGSLIPDPPSSASTWKKVEEKKGWSTCSACAGNPSGTGPVGTYWFKQGITSPALDGNSMQGYIGGWVPWADAVYAYHFGPQSWASHVLYTVHFLWNASKTRSGDGAYVVQAVEFDSFLFSGGYKYMFGTQCDYAGGYWGVWNGPDNSWKDTSLKCEKFPPNQWHTITWYGDRDPSTKKLHFVAVAIDGVQHNIDVWMDAIASSSTDDFGIQFQQDSDQYGSPWSEYVDQVTVSIW
ncbi:MAG: hypothetical protein ACM3PW_06580 [Chlamydiota bacterium]